MNRLWISPIAFTVAFSCTYAFTFAKNWPLFLYYPLHHDFSWGYQVTKGMGPAMAWYGLMADAGFVALMVSIRITPRLACTWSRNYLSIFPIGAMLVAAFLLRRLFF